MNRKIFYLLLALTIASLSLGTAHPVSAEAPVIFYFDRTYDIPDIGTCQEPVAWHSTGYYTMKGWPHEPWYWERSFLAYQNVEVTVSANGKSLRAIEVGPVHYRITWITDTFSEDYLESVGPFDFIVAPGMGPVFGFAGRIVDHYHTYVVNEEEYYQEYVETVEMKGKWFDDLPAFCAYFGSVPK
jgi:hypothetical protein